MTQLTRFQYVTETATDASRMTIQETAQFHYWNPNGLCAEKKKLDVKISELVFEGKIKSGWVVAFGSFNNFHTEEIRMIANGKRVSRISLSVAVEGLHKNTKKGFSELAKEGF